MPETLAVVTTVWGEHQRFLPDWLDSIWHGTELPDEVVIVAGPDAAVSARMVLLTGQMYEKGHEVRSTLVAPARVTGHGQMRNLAAGSATADWVMHLDADDLLLPHALQDVRVLMIDADVVAIGGVRDGQARCFTGITAGQVASGAMGAYSCAAFRRTFWERSPWIEHNDYVDSVFWVGLAQLGARWAATARPGFIYRQHAGQYSRTLTLDQKRQALRQWRKSAWPARRNPWSLSRGVTTGRPRG